MYWIERSSLEGSIAVTVGTGKHASNDMDFESKIVLISKLKRAKVAS